MRHLTFLLLLACALLTGCGEVRVANPEADALRTEAAAQKVRADAAAAQAERAKKSNDELQVRIAQDRGIIEAAQADIAADQAQIRANDEAHWSTIAYICAGVLGLAVLVFAFLAWESPVWRLRFASAAVFAGVAAATCLWVGREMHAILEAVPWLVAASVVVGVLGVLERGRVRDFLAKMFVRTSGELERHAPDAGRYLDKFFVDQQGKLQPAVTKILARVKGT